MTQINTFQEEVKSGYICERHAQGYVTTCVEEYPAGPFCPTCVGTLSKKKPWVITGNDVGTAWNVPITYSNFNFNGNWQYAPQNVAAATVKALSDYTKKWSGGIGSFAGLPVRVCSIDEDPWEIIDDPDDDF